MDIAIAEVLAFSVPAGAGKLPQAAGLFVAAVSRTHELDRWLAHYHRSMPLVILAYCPPTQWADVRLTGFEMRREAPESHRLNLLLRAVDQTNIDLRLATVLRLPDLPSDVNCPVA